MQYYRGAVALPVRWIGYASLVFPARKSGALRRSELTPLFGLRQPSIAGNKTTRVFPESAHIQYLRNGMERGNRPFTERFGMGGSNQVFSSRYDFGGNSNSRHGLGGKRSHGRKRWISWRGGTRIGIELFWRPNVGCVHACRLHCETQIRATGVNPES